MDREVDKWKTAFTTKINSTSKAEKLVNLGLQTTKFCCPTSNHPGLTLRLLYMYMTMQLRSGHVSLLRTKFQPFNCPPMDLRRRAALRWALLYISNAFQREIPEISWPIAVKFCVVLGSMFYFITPVQFFLGGECSQKNFAGEKHANFGLISDPFPL